MAKTEKRTIRHALFTYRDPETGAEQLAMRGAEVDLLPEDIARGEKFEAFGDLEPVGVLAPYPLEDTDDPHEAEQDAWVHAGKVQEIIDAVNARPEIADSVLAAEQRRGDKARTTLLQSLGEYIAGA